MKRTIQLTLLVAVLISTTSCFVKREKRETKYSSGQIKAQYQVRKHKSGSYLWDGPFISYYTNGEKHAEGTYRMRSPQDTTIGSTGIPQGGREGDWSFWYENGQLKQSSSYCKGKLDGTYAMWHKNGQLKQTGIYLKGVPTDSSVSYDENGNRLSLSLFTPINDSDVSSVRTTWLATGEKQGEFNYINEMPHGTSTNWYKSGTVNTTAEYTQGKLNGLLKSWHENGEKKMEQNFSNNRREGKTTIWYDNGTVQAIFNYANDKQHGINTTFDRNGTKIIESTYQNGILQGKYTVWHPNGKMQTEGVCNGNTPSGEWRFWNEKGELTTTGIYVSKAKEGLWNFRTTETNINFTVTLPL